MDRKSVLKYSQRVGFNFNYPLAKRVDKNLVKLTKDIKRRLKKELLPQLNAFTDFKIVFATNTKKHILGKYVNGSYQKPIILLNLKTIKSSCKKYNVGLLHCIETTILHELAHAIQDLLDIYLDEQEAEDFATDYYDFGTINLQGEKNEQMD